MANDQKKLVKRFYDECVNNKNLNIIDQLCAPDYKQHGLPNVKPGPEGLKSACDDFLTGFPDMKIVVEEYRKEGDNIIARGYWQGTHKGDFMNVHATGKQVRLPFVDEWKIKDGQLAESWLEMDIDNLMDQLGRSASAA